MMTEFNLVLKDVQPNAGTSKRWKATKSALMCAAVAIASPATLWASTPLMAAERAVQINIPAGPLDDALIKLSLQTGMVISVEPALVSGRTASAINATMAPEQALGRLLSNSGLTYRHAPDGGYAVVRPALQKINLAQETSTVAARAAAPAPAPVGLEDIVVTARKQSESLIDVPVAVAAFSNTDLQRYSATDLGKIAQLAPQVIVTRGQAGGGASFVIRGLGSSSGEPGLEQSVSVNIDGVQVGRGRVLSLGQFDLQRVEIMKGPQALYFGRNSPAGVISVTSAGATDELSGYVKAGYEFVARERIIEGAISGPIAENLNARLAVRGRKMDGWLINKVESGPNPIDNRYPIGELPYHRLPRTNEIAGRLTVDYKPTDDTDVTLKVLAGRSNEGTFSGAGQTLCYAPSTSITTNGFVNPGTSTDCRLNNQTQYYFAAPEGASFNNWPGMRSDGSAFAITKTVLASLAINHSFGDLDLASVTGYFDLNFKGAGQATVAAVPATVSVLGERTKTFSQELRLNSRYDGPLNFTLGAFYSKNDMRVINNSAFYFLRLGPDPVTGRDSTFDRYSRSKGTVLSGFGQLRWAVAENVEVAGGVRYTHEKKNGAAANVYLHSGFTATNLPAGVYIRDKRRENNWSPEATITWHPAPHHTVYAAYKTGYKAGGQSWPAPLSRTTTAEQLDFDEEKIKGGELGYKAELFNRTVRFDIVGYSYKVTGLQILAFDAVAVTTFTTNAADARTRGVEFSASWQATDQLRLRSQIGYNRAKYLSFPNSPCYLLQTAAEGCVGRAQDLGGRPLTRAPKLAFSVGASYDQPIGNELNLGVDVDVSHTSSYFRQENQHPLSRQPSYELLNAAIRLGQIDKGWELSLQGRNLTNKYYADVSVDQPFGGRNQFFAYAARPREVILQASYRF